jgi:hypothetical protein
MNVTRQYCNRNHGGIATLIGKDEEADNFLLDYGGKTVTVTLKTAGGTRSVMFDRENPTDPLFTVKAGVTFTLEEGITLSGAEVWSDTSLVLVDGGSFIMNGGTLSGNTAIGGGVYILDGTGLCPVR